MKLLTAEVPPNCIVSSGGYMKRRDLKPASDLSPPALIELAVAQAPPRSQAQMREFSCKRVCRRK